MSLVQRAVPIVPALAPVKRPNASARRAAAVVHAALPLLPKAAPVAPAIAALTATDACSGITRTPP